MRRVQYLCRKPGASGELVYPTELPDDYQGLGSFFLGGSDFSCPDEIYAFHAYLNGSVLPVELRHLIGSSWEARVDGVGVFRFRAVLTGVPARYSGAYPFPDGALIRQLAPRDRTEMEEAARSKDFYFVGYSPRLDGEVEVPVSNEPTPTGHTYRPD